MGSCFTRAPDVDFNGPVDFNHFHILRAIGKGAFGKVCIVKKKDTKEMYAMKYMNKVQIIHKHAVENVLRESEILRQLEHTFLVNLWFTFQDQEDLFMVLDLMLGGDISYHLEKEGRFAVTRVRLYIAELSLALEYLREHNVIHRDVKPANMLLDSGGHVHLTDFNVACIVHPGVPITSVTGTKPYMAPEVLHARSSSGYSYAVDWWGLGVSVYEMLRGQRPFSIDRHMTNEEIVSNIRHTRPSASVRWDHQTCDLLRMLLHPDEDKRLQSVESMRQHRFFQSIDWDQVEKKEVTPVYIPAQNRIHCDPTHELEEMIVEPNPLHKKQHRLSRRNFRVEDETLVDDLKKLGRRFPEYNRLREKEPERRKSSADADGDVQGPVCLDGTNDSKRTPDQKVEIKDQSSNNSLKRSDQTSTDRQSQRESSGPVELEETSQREATSSNATSDVVQDTVEEKCEDQNEKGEETQPNQEPEITAEREREEDSDKRASGDDDKECVVEEDQLPSAQTEEPNPQPEKEQEAAAGEETSLQQVQVQVSEDASSPSPRSSVGSSPHNPPTRTESMNSGAMLLPREL